MLKVTRKEYEIEETIQAVGNDGEVLYEFQMQLTDEETLKFRKLLFDENYKLSKKMNEENEEEITEKLLKMQEELEDICFKEHKEPFLKALGQYKYDEMVEMLVGFFIELFAEKRTQQINTMTSSLRKISNN